MKTIGRRTSYCGLSMRSRLEAGFASHLDRHVDELGFTWRYEPRAYANRHGQYLPDFEITLGDHRAFIEVKPTHAQALGAHVRMRIILDTHPDAELWTANPVGDHDTYQPETFRWQLDRVPTHQAGDVAHTLARGGLPWRRYDNAWHHDDLTVVHHPDRHHALEAARTIRQHHPDRIIYAAHGTPDGPHLHLEEIGRDGSVIDTFDHGHHFTHGPIDMLRPILAAR